MSTLGGWDDIEGYVVRLANAPDYGVLVITIDGSEDFLQFSASRGTVQMDFPLVTPTQQSREQAIREFFRARGHTLIENRGSEGSRFLDWDFAGDPIVVADLTKIVLTSLFGATEATRFRFQTQGLGNSP